MQQVQGGRFARAVQRLFGTQGKLSLQLDSVIVPTVTMADLSDLSEGFPAVGQVNVPAGGAGNQGHVQLVLPSSVAGDFGLEIRLSHILITGTVATNLVMGRSPGLTGPTNVVQKRWRDTGRQGFPTGLIQYKNNTPAVANVPDELVVPIVANQTTRVDLDWSIVVGDSSGFMVFCQSVNTAFRVAFFWREIPPQ